MAAASTFLKPDPAGNRLQLGQSACRRLATHCFCENRFKTEPCCSGPEVRYVQRMIAQSEIRQMSLPEKVALLETVWSEIAADPSQVEVPQWHKDILDERDLALKEGRATVLEWDEAKGQIDKATR